MVTCLKRPLFLCPKGDLLIQVWLVFYSFKSCYFYILEICWWLQYSNGKVLTVFLTIFVYDMHVCGQRSFSCFEISLHVPFKTTFKKKFSRSHFYAILMKFLPFRIFCSFVILFSHSFLILVFKKMQVKHEI